MAVMKLALVLFLMAFTATAVSGRRDPNTVLAQAMMNGGEANYMVKSTTGACCNNCTCTKSDPPQCRCNDVGTTCHSACKNCICLLIWPPSCSCYDVTTFCYDPCPSSSN
ncbi:Bowman-Birk type proteinase inhibitor-like [Neltuma alba]|uniref:Bowman-Birk type proteinase inhibitor-like n=1 Tax=Neltuma alba TaxID=207710 RepID=UPI0010A2BBEA|nr:Bowman-Birk type proteinase inhibitor-like [Prosopis alba]